MLAIYKTVEGEGLKEIENLSEKGSWIYLVDPAEEEILKVSEAVKIPADVISYALDEEESSRIDYDDNYVLIIIKIPILNNGIYDTIPLGIIITDDCVVTVCLKKNPIVEEFIRSKPRDFYTYKKTRFLLQFLFKTATYYLRYLQQIDKKSDEIEKKLHQSMKNEELIELLKLEKSLVYFTTSLKSNEIVMEKLLKSRLLKGLRVPESSGLIKMYEEDEDLLEDVITENKQAIEMSEIYSSILSGTMDAYASVISNNLNIVMKFLTSVTIVLTIPTLIASLYGMNVPLPFQHSPLAFGGILTASFVISLATAMVFAKWKMF
ncbi:magnesium transporter CorA family protein [Thermoanaerobacterium sp. DL9XJH110]|uniref:magnesium transporter CorA family protein n=1 Tax=Thermoanaerobacterium sp. DL9XJH110 TaxID=3386643 RepID=UPI003BB5AFDC